MKCVIDPYELSEKLLDYREKHKVNGKKMTQEQLSDIIGIHPFTLRRWERVNAQYSVRISPIMFKHLRYLKII